MNNQQKVWSIGVWVGVLLAVFLGVLSIKELKSISYIGKNQQIVNSISVNGKGEAVSIPDIATFSFTVSETAKTVLEAQKAATEKINSTLKAIRAGGVADKDIQTLSYNINPHYEYQDSLCTTISCRPGKSVLTGYEVSQSVQVKVRDLSKAGDLFGSIGSFGVQNVNGLTFSIDDIETVKTKARALAIADAQVKAKSLAKQLGVSIVGITSFYDSSNQPSPMYGLGAMNMSDSVSAKVAVPVPEIPAGEQKVISNVTITYEIE